MVLNSQLFLILYMDKSPVSSPTAKSLFDINSKDEGINY